MKIEILDFGVIQSYQERFHIPFTSSITRWTYEVFNALLSEGEDIVELWFAKTVLPSSHAINPLQWSIALASKVKFPYINGRSDSGFSIITASNTPIESNLFLPRLVASLQQDKVVTYKISDIPNSYQSNPYQLMYKIRNLKNPLQIKVKKSGDKVTFSLKTL